MRQSFSFKKALAYSAVITALTLGSGQVSAADASSGGINGYTESNASVIIKNNNTGFQREVMADEWGRFNFSTLPVGTYTLESSGQTRQVIVTIGTNTEVDLADTNVITVVGGTISAIDTSSAESTTVFTSDDLEELPISRNITSAALLAPGTVKGDEAFGNLASFGGSSVAENGYFINGFDVTNIRKFTSFAALPFDAISQQGIKTGGYGAEYGRSLGGVINLVTKSGTNEWEFGVSAYYTPEAFKGTRRDQLSLDPAAAAGNQYYVYESPYEINSLTYNITAGGPIIQDKLFVYAMYEGRNYERDRYYSISSQHYTNKSPQYLVKLDWNITDDHLLEYTHINNELNKRDYVFYKHLGDYYGSTHRGDAIPFSYSSGGTVDILKYTGYITNDLIVSALYGKMDHLLGERNPIANNAHCPRVYERLTNASSSTPLGCSTQTYVPDSNFGPNTDSRESLRLGLEWFVGDHTIRLGIDNEEFTSFNQGKRYTGGEYWRWHRGTGGTVNGVTVANGDIYVRHRTYESVSSSFLVENSAYYLEDSWQATDDLMLYLGIRSEGFTNYNSANIPFIDVSNSIAPRLGFAYDLDSDGSKKLYGTLGRYYIPVASNTSIRASGAIRQMTEYFYADVANMDPQTGAPTSVGARIGPQRVSGSLTPAHPATIAATDLQPMHQDELILGYQQKAFDNWIFGVKYVNRKVRDGMDDFCSRQPFIDWANDQGYTNFDYRTMAKCFLINPGRDITLALDVENNGTFAEHTVPASYLGLDTYQRKYSALEFSWERAKRDGWYISGSYTYAKSEGNIEGYVDSTTGQDDAGYTQNVDHRFFQDGAYGLLPNDRKHTLKMFGLVDLTDEFALSANMLLQSGRPVSCTSYIPLDTAVLGVDYSQFLTYNASSFYCNGQVGQRGNYGRTPWTHNVSLGVRYVPEWADQHLTIKLDVFNLFNIRKVTTVEEASQVNGATSPRPNPNFLTPTSFQSPRSVRISARYEF